MQVLYQIFNFRIKCCKELAGNGRSLDFLGVIFIRMLSQFIAALMAVFLLYSVHGTLEIFRFKQNILVITLFRFWFFCVCFQVLMLFLLLFGRDVKSNKLGRIPDLSECKDLRLL